MRTTIELREDQHRALGALAQRRGQRGFSQLVQEALDAYLDDLGADEVQALLGLEGTLSDEDARRVGERIAEVRGSWRAS